MVTSVLLRTLCAVLVWWALVEGDASTYVYGLAAVPATVATSYAMTGRASGGSRVTLGRVAAAIGLVGWVLRRSVSGGADVARRALWLPRPDVDPRWESYTTHLASPRARVLLAFVVNLMPGSLSARLDGDRFDVHVISPELDVAASIAELERRIERILPHSA